MVIIYVTAFFAGYGSVCYYEVTLENIDTRTVCNQQVKHSMRVNKVYYMWLLAVTVGLINQSINQSMNQSIG